MTVNDMIYEMKKDFKSKYNYLSDKQLDDLYNCSLNLYLTLAFPFDKSIMELPQEYARDVSVIRAIMEETLERDGLSGVVAYSENGMSFTFENAHISNQILSLITPKAKAVPK